MHVHLNAGRQTPLKWYQNRTRYVPMSQNHIMVSINPVVPRYHRDSRATRLPASPLGPNAVHHQD